jgi:hypothetical protein
VPRLWRAADKCLIAGVMASEGNFRILLHLPIHAPLAPQGWAAGVDGDLGWWGRYGGSRGKAGAALNDCVMIGKQKAFGLDDVAPAFIPLVNRVSALGRGGSGVYGANRTAYGALSFGYCRWTGVVGLRNEGSSIRDNDSSMPRSGGGL